MTHLANAESALNIASDNLLRIKRARHTFDLDEQYWKGRKVEAENSVDWLKAAQVEVNELKSQIADLQQVLIDAKMMPPEAKP